MFEWTTEFAEQIAAVVEASCKQRQLKSNT